MASVKKREWASPKGEKKTAWVVRYTDLSGTPRLKTFKAKKEADAYRAKVETEIGNNLHLPDSEAATVAAACEAYKKHIGLRLKEKRISRSHHNRMCGVLDRYVIPKLGRVKLNRLTWTQVEEWHQGMVESGLAPISAKNYFTVFAQVEKFARKRGLTTLRVVSDACNEVRGVKSDRIRTFQLEEVRTLVSVVYDRPKGSTANGHSVLRLAVLTAAFCGLRYGEIVGLTLPCLDLEAGILSVRHSLDEMGVLKGPKTKSGVRDVPLPATLVAMFREHIERFYQPNERQLVFTSRYATAIRHGNFVHHQWLPLLRRAGLQEKGDDNYHFHALRHFAASMMIDQKMALPDVAASLGHRTYDMTLQTYAHAIVRDGRGRKVVEAMSGELLPRLPTHDTGTTSAL